jgi:alkanesulfonate monooxygenase SsuD/methylene tetrahydromethanopterin reductase-like flavin-dependent oxidoreductase (luciferase family)
VDGSTIKYAEITWFAGLENPVPGFDCRRRLVNVGIALPSMVPGLDRDLLLSWMRGADAGPFSVLGVGERIGYPNQEMMTTLAAAAAVTERIGIEATVSVTPMHPAVHIAKQAATIDVISGGRFTLGVGVGGRDEDYRLLQAPFERRHARLDEQVDVMRRVWRGEAPYAGTTAVGPAPVQAGGPRVLSGAMGPKSMARSAGWADGLAGFDIAGDAASIVGSLRAFEAAWADAGRAGKPFLQSSCWFGLTDDAPERVPDYAYRYLRIFGDTAARSMAGMCRATSAEAVGELIASLHDEGCDELILVATSSSVEDLERAADLISAL